MSPLKGCLSPLCELDGNKCMIFRAEIQNENEGGGNGTQQAAAAAVFFFLKTATEGTFSKYIVKVRFHVFPA